MVSLLESVRASLEGGTPDPSRLDEGLRDWALRTGIAPFLYCRPDGERASAASGVVDGWPELEAAVLGAKLRSEALRATLADCLALARAHLDGPLVLLKGAATSSELYPEPWLRPMRDLDVLVPEAALARFGEILVEAGFAPDSHNPDEYYADHHHGVPLLDRARNVWVEPHVDLFPRRNPLAHTRAFARSTWEAELTATTVLGHDACHFTPEYQLLHTACHWAQLRGPVGALPGLVDLALILRGRAETLDWQRLESWIAEPAVRATAVPALAFLQAHGLVELEGTPGARLVRAEVRRLGRSIVALQHRLIRSFCFEGRRERFLGDDARAVLWEALNQPGSRMRRLARGTWHLAFPPKVRERYSPRFQLGRLRRALRPDSRG